MFADVIYWIFCLGLGLGLVVVRGEDHFNISTVEVVWSPPDCGDISLIILIHSHPAHLSLRKTLRETWARQVSQGQFKTRTVFVIGQVQQEDLSRRLEEERRTYSDLVAGHFVDSYRNLTYKHLLGYRWVTEHCEGADFVLKSDDDQFVDTFQLPRYLQTFLPPPSQAWFLCNILQRAPIRSEDSKWFVSQSEWPESAYPPYCAGWAYVTTLPTVSRVLAWAGQHQYFWIDDLHVTGFLPARHGGLPMFNWVYSFLTTHVQYNTQILEGSFYTPELMVCGDISSDQILHVYSKAEKCERRQCSDIVYTDHDNRAAIKPRLAVQSQGQDFEPREEL